MVSYLEFKSSNALIKMNLKKNNISAEVSIQDNKPSNPSFITQIKKDTNYRKYKEGINSNSANFNSTFMNQTRKNSVLNNPANFQNRESILNLKKVSSEANFYNPLMLNNKPDFANKNERKQSLINNFKLKRLKNSMTQEPNIFIFEPEDESPNNDEEKVVRALNQWDEKNIQENIFPRTPKKKILKTINRRVESFMNLVQAEEDEANEEEELNNIITPQEIDRVKAISSLETLNGVSRYKSLNPTIIGGKKYFPFEEKEEASMFVYTLGITRKKFNNNLLNEYPASNIIVNVNLVNSFGIKLCSEATLDECKLLGFFKNVIDKRIRLEAIYKKE